MKISFVPILLFINISSVFSVRERPKVCPNILSKSRWGGEPPTSINYTIIPVKYVIIHHTVTPPCLDEDACSARLVNIQNMHMKTLGFEDIGYNFMIGGDGKIYEGRGWHRQGAHTYGYNSKSIGIAFVGDFTTDKATPQQLEAGKKLIECGVKLGELDKKYKLLGGKSVIATESPGKTLYQEIQEWDGFARRP